MHSCTLQYITCRHVIIHINITHRWEEQSRTLQAWSLLPEAWRQLARGAQWCLKTEREREHEHNDVIRITGVWNCVIAYTCNQSWSHGYNHWSTADCSDVAKVSYSSRNPSHFVTGCCSFRWGIHQYGFKAYFKVIPWLFDMYVFMFRYVIHEDASTHTVCWCALIDVCIGVQRWLHLYMLEHFQTHLGIENYIALLLFK